MRPKTNRPTDDDLNETAENEAAILREHGGGYATQMVLDLPIIEEPYDAAFIFEVTRALIETAEEAGIPPTGIATGLIAAAANYTTEGVLDQASQALAPFRQAETLDDPNCQCPRCLSEVEE